MRRVRRRRAWSARVKRLTEESNTDEGEERESFGPATALSAVSFHLHQTRFASDQPHPNLHRSGMVTFARDETGEVLLWELTLKRPTRVGRPAHAGSILTVGFVDATTILTYVADPRLPCPPTALPKRPSRLAQPAQPARPPSSPSSPRPTRSPALKPLKPLKPLEPLKPLKPRSVSRLFATAKAGTR